VDPPPVNSPEPETVNIYRHNTSLPTQDATGSPHRALSGEELGSNRLERLNSQGQLA